MNQSTLYRDIAGRCGGDIYLGVVGPVRTGKSTFIKRFMELLVLPNISEAGRRQRTVDELPQSGAGKTIMTVQPQFVPDKAVSLTLRDEANMRVRLVDCVGYLIDGALGLSEDGTQRMVRTPWFEHDVPFEQAAEVGTRKVIQEHSTIGVVVTTDGSITDIPRENYVDAEKRVVNELKAMGKPFSVVLNSEHPQDAQTQTLRASLEKEYQVPVVALDVMNMGESDLNGLLESILFEFPLTEIRINAPTWLTSLEPDHWLAQEVFAAVKAAAPKMHRVRDHGLVKQALSALPSAEDASVSEIRLDDGTIDYRLTLKDGLFYRVLGEACGQEIADEEHLFELMRDLIVAKREYDRVSSALESVRTTGYGVVTPTMDEMTLEEPEIVRQGSRFGVKLKASAPSLHMIRVQIQTEVSPIVGTEQQSADLKNYLLSEFEGDSSGIWDTQIFGKSLNELVREGLSGKLMRMPEDARMKLQESLEKIINEGNGGMICILL